MTIAVREDSGSLCCSVEETTDGASDATEDIILSPAAFAASGSGGLLLALIGQVAEPAGVAPVLAQTVSLHLHHSKNC
jgi:hypothetical protein